MSDKKYKFNSEELQIALRQVRETQEAIRRLEKFIEDTAGVSSDAIALQRASALKTIHHLEGQITEWIRRYPSLDSE